MYRPPLRFAKGVSHRSRGWLGDFYERERDGEAMVDARKRKEEIHPVIVM